MRMENQNRYNSIKRILIVILFLNWAVALAKIAYGIFTRCASISADGFHSFSDGTSNIIGLIGITFASQPKDKDHPYGHKKYETFFSLGIAALLFIIAVELVEKSFERLHTPVIPEVNLQSFLVMMLTLTVNLFVMKFECAAGKRLKSDILVADSIHTRADIFITLSVILALVAIKLGYPVLDPVITIMIALCIAYTGVTIARTGSKVLCDKAVIIDDKMICDIVLAIEGVKACHKIRTRGREDDIHIDLHVQVSPSMRMDKAHKISYSIEEALKKGIPGVTDVIVHMEPKD